MIRAMVSPMGREAGREVLYFEVSSQLKERGEDRSQQRRETVERGQASVMKTREERFRAEGTWSIRMNK